MESRETEVMSLLLPASFASEAGAEGAAGAGAAGLVEAGAGGGAGAGALGSSAYALRVANSRRPILPSKNSPRFALIFPIAPSPVRLDAASTATDYAHSRGAAPAPERSQ